jgi:hypothetical protein
MLGEFTPLTDKAKMKGLKGEHRYYYVFFIATEKEARGNGYAMAMIRHVRNIPFLKMDAICLPGILPYGFHEALCYYIWVSDEIIVAGISNQRPGSSLA